MFKKTMLGPETNSLLIAHWIQNLFSKMDTRLPETYISIVYKHAYNMIVYITCKSTQLDYKINLQLITC